MIEIQLLTSMGAEPLFAKPWPYARRVKLYRSGEDVVDFVFEGGKKTTKTVYTVPPGKLLVIPINPHMWEDHRDMFATERRKVDADRLIVEMLQTHAHPIERVKIRYL